MEMINISEIDVAKRQLGTAVNLFFFDEDPVSIHTLVRASHEILEKLCKAKNIQSITEGGLKFIKEDKREEVKKALSTHKNFFKHGTERKPSTIKTEYFDSKLNIFYLFDSCRLYELLTSEKYKPFLIFIVWFCLKYPQLLADTGAGELADKINDIGKGLDIEDKPSFYKEASNAYGIAIESL